MPTPNWNLPNDLTLAAPNNPPADINALANAVETALDIEKTERLDSTTPVTVTVPMVGVWSASALTVTKIGKLVILNGILGKTNNGTIAQGINANIGVIGVGYRPKDAVDAPAVGYISGSSVEYQSNVIVRISLAGNITLHNTTVLTNARVAVAYLTA